MKFKYTTTEGGRWQNLNCGKLDREEVIHVLVNKTKPGMTVKLLLRKRWTKPLVVASILFKDGYYWCSMVPGKIQEYYKLMGVDKSQVDKVWEG